MAFRPRQYLLQSGPLEVRGEREVHVLRQAWGPED
jgi:hypothetical protein